MGSIGNQSIKFTLHDDIKHKGGVRVCSHMVTSVCWSWHCQEMELGVVDPMGVQQEQEVPRSRTSSCPRAAVCPSTAGWGWIPFLSIQYATTTRELHPTCGIPGLQIMLCKCQVCPKNTLQMHK